MRERTIMIFPKFNNMEIIDSIRKKYDPLADLVRPHITLVFPFHSDITDAELGSHIENAISGISPFSLHPAGIFKQEDAFGNYLFLDVKEGKKELIRLHDRLYSLFFCRNTLQPSYDSGKAGKPGLSQYCI